MIPYTVPELDSLAPHSILKDTLLFHVQNGSSVKKLEQKFADMAGTRYAVAFASARAALYYSYRFFLRPGQKIVLPAYTCIPAIDAVRWAGAVPHFVDIDPNSYNPRFDKKLARTGGIGAISLSYLYGLIGDLDPFLAYARENDIPVIEDAAIALGGSYKSKKAGAIGDAGVFSLQESKTITAWRGGMVTTNNKDLYRFLAEQTTGQSSLSSPKLVFNLGFSVLRSLCHRPLAYGLTMYPLKQAMTSRYLKGTLQRIMNFNPLETRDGLSPAAMPTSDRARFANIQASVALRSLRRLDTIITKRRQLARLLQEELADVPGIQIPREEQGVRHAYGRFPVRFIRKNKAAIHHQLLEKGVETALNYPYICPATPHMKPYGFRNTDYPHALTASKETLLLPFHTRLTGDDVHAVTRAVREVLQ